MATDIERHKARVVSVADDGSVEVTLVENGLQLSCFVDRMMKRWGVSLSPQDLVSVEYPDGEPSRARIMFRHLQQ